MRGAGRASFPRLPAPAERLFDVAPDTRVLAHCHWQPDAPAHPALLALHGLEGSSSAHYMRGLADKALRAGFNVVLLNQRNCGGTERLSAGLYHSGLTADADHVMREVSRADGHRSHRRRRLLARRQPGAQARRRLRRRTARRELRGVCAVSPVMELEACVRALERRQNFIYQWNFVRGLKAPHAAQGARASRAASRSSRSSASARSASSTRSTPRRISGSADATDYYHRASAMRVIDRIARAGAHHHRRRRSVRADAAVPRSARHGNPHIRVIVTRHGGHCAFLTEPRPATTATGRRRRSSTSRVKASRHESASISALSRTPAPAPALRA